MDVLNSKLDLAEERISRSAARLKEVFKTMEKQEK